MTCVDVCIWTLIVNMAHRSNEIHTCAIVAEAGPYVVDIRRSHRDATCMYVESNIGL